MKKFTMVNRYLFAVTCLQLHYMYNHDYCLRAQAQSLDTQYSYVPKHKYYREKRTKNSLDD